MFRAVKFFLNIDEESVKAQTKFDKQNERNHIHVTDQPYSRRK